MQAQRSSPGGMSQSPSPDPAAATATAAIAPSRRDAGAGAAALEKEAPRRADAVLRRRTADRRRAAMGVVLPGVRDPGLFAAGGYD